MSSDFVPVIDKHSVFGAKELEKVRRSHFLRRDSINHDLRIEEYYVLSCFVTHESVRMILTIT